MHTTSVIPRIPQYPQRMGTTLEDSSWANRHTQSPPWSFFWLGFTWHPTPYTPYAWIIRMWLYDYMRLFHLWAPKSSWDLDKTRKLFRSSMIMLWKLVGDVKEINWTLCSCLRFATFFTNRWPFNPYTCGQLKVWGGERAPPATGVVENGFTLTKIRSDRIASSTNLLPCINKMLIQQQLIWFFSPNVQYV